MEPVDIFATKGIEYLYVIGYLLLFVPFWVYLAGQRRRSANRTARIRVPAWFAVPDGYYFHPGHTWARRDSGTDVRVGLDALATGLMGVADAVTLPPLGQRLDAGQPAATIEIGGQHFDLLSPTGGVVTAVNPAVSERPDALVEDPYGAGWLFSMVLRDRDEPGRNLLTGDEARSWMGAAEAAMMQSLSGEGGSTLQDGGEVIPGFGRRLAPERWPTLVAQVLRSNAGAPRVRS